MLGALSLQSAESEPDTPNAMASLSTAHKVLTHVLAFKGTLSQKDTAVVCWLLAQVELLGNLRRKQEKAEAHVMQVRLFCPDPFCLTAVSAVLMFLPILLYGMNAGD